MTRMLTLAAAAVVAVTGAADAQQVRPAHVADSSEEAGAREGNEAGARRGVGGYAALGAFTGFVAGGVGLPLLLSAGVQSIAGAAAFIPLVWTVAATRESWVSPPPEVAQRIHARPPAYQKAFRVAYAERVSRRRHRAALVGGVAGGVAGLATFVGLVIYALSHIDY